MRASTSPDVLKDMMAQMPVDTYAVPEGFDLEGFDLQVDGDSGDLSDGFADQWHMAKWRPTRGT